MTDRDGWKLVPVEPTAEHFAGAWPHGSPELYMLRQFWTAMLAASPPPDGYQTGPENEDASPRADPQTGIDCTAERVAPAPTIESAAQLCEAEAANCDELSSMYASRTPGEDEDRQAAWRMRIRADQCRTLAGLIRELGDGQ